MYLTQNVVTIHIIFICGLEETTMTEENKGKLVEAGMDVDAALVRFMNNEALLEKFMKKFLADQSYLQLIGAVEEGNVESSFAAAHTLKGVAANFSFEGLRNKASDACEEFRAGNFDSGKSLIPAVTEEYDKLISVIKELYGE